VSARTGARRMAAAADLMAGAHPEVGYRRSRDRFEPDARAALNLLASWAVMLDQSEAAQATDEA
jgi:hypothetical protein